MSGVLPSLRARPARPDRRRIAATLVLAALALPAVAAVRPPRLAYTLTTLPNGLRLVTLEDHSTPIVHLEVWYHVGSKDERAGRTGFAHLFEHMMFKGSKNVGTEQHTALISSVGGLSNAYTNEDVTVFWETVPAQYLPLALWLEADRMASLRVDRKVFERERDVVKEERRMRIDNQPYGRLPELIYDQAFKVHPYKHATIGSMKDLEAASIDDVREFYRTYYVPENATVALAGDFDTAQAVALATRYLGRVPKAAGPVPRNIPQEPAPTGPRHVTLEEPWPLPVVVVAHHVPRDADPDGYALTAASKILSDGQSSRIYRKLVYETGVAVAAFGGGTVTEDPNLFFAVAVVQAGHTAAEAEEALAAELDRLRTEPVTEAELQRAKHQFARDYIVGRETVRQKASALAHALVFHGDPAAADGEFDIFMALTTADIQRAARKYFAPEGRLTLTVVPRGAPREEGR